MRLLLLCFPLLFSLAMSAVAQEKKPLFPEIPLSCNIPVVWQYDYNSTNTLAYDKNGFFIMASQNLIAHGDDHLRFMLEVNCSHLRLKHITAAEVIDYEAEFLSLAQKKLGNDIIEFSGMPSFSEVQRLNAVCETFHFLTANQDAAPAVAMLKFLEDMNQLIPEDLSKIIANYRNCAGLHSA